MNRVAITGLGTINALGGNAEATATALKMGQSAIRALGGAADDPLSSFIGAPVMGFDAKAHFEDRRLSLLDRCSQLALVAAREAVTASGVDFRKLGPRGAVIIGSGVGGMGTMDENFQRLYGERAKRFPPMTIPRMMISAPVSHVSMEHGITGPAFAVASACASANHAIGVAFQLVRAGAVDAAIAGGTEAALTPGTLKAWEAMRILAPDTCRPFSRDRLGLVLGEGAGMVVLENFAAATARGATILGELAGFGMGADAADLILPSVDGAAAAMRAALDDGGLAAEDIDYINAHGTGTAMNDVTETKAIRAVFGAHADRVAVSSTKAMHGHCLGAAGAVELAATLLAMRDGFLPPTANFTDADPQCDLDYVPDRARDAVIRAALSNSFAFGGLNAVLAIRAAPC